MLGLRRLSLTIIQGVQIFLHRTFHAAFFLFVSVTLLCFGLCHSSVWYYSARDSEFTRVMSRGMKYNFTHNTLEEFHRSFNVKFDNTDSAWVDHTRLD